MNNSTLVSSQSYNPLEWQKGYESQYNEYDYAIEEITGTIPADLNGTLYRNGPGLLDIGGVPIQHPFDGDGAISAVFFARGCAHFRSRFVRTEAFVKEREAEKILYRGVFGTQKPGGWWKNAFDLRLKNIANTNVIYWGDKLLALWEAAEPYRLDADTLETIGIDYLNGVLQPGSSFSAHPRIDPACKFDGGSTCLVNFAMETGLSTKLKIYEFNPDGKLMRQYSHIISGFAFIHDFVITPNYCIFFQNPVTFNPLPFLLGWRGAGECVNFQPQGETKVIVIPRDRQGNLSVKTFTIKSGFVFHHANAFEKDDLIVIDSICYASLAQINPNSNYKEIDFNTLAPGQLWRFTLNSQDGTTKKELIESRCCEFPALAPNLVGRDYRYLFIGATHEAHGNAPLQAILKLDLQTGDRQLHSFAPQGFVSEPIFVPKNNPLAEDDGWIITVVYDAKRERSNIVILDGNNLNKEPIATLHLKHHIPYGLHGSWREK
jgi:all-trans-8'-apo-beta-carotenal 15,15'-oxygenase